MVLVLALSTLNKEMQAGKSLLKKDSRNGELKTTIVVVISIIFSLNNETVVLNYATQILGS